MATEIERRFLLTPEQCDQAIAASEKPGKSIRQAYLAAGAACSVRVRVAGAPGHEAATMTVKSAGSGATRQEFEYDIPPADAEAMMMLRVGRVIEKTRWKVDVEGMVFEIDRFHGDLDGLHLAEVELDSEDTRIPRPPWLGTEITGDKRFSNADLALSERIPDL